MIERPKDDWEAGNAWLGPSCCAGVPAQPLTARAKARSRDSAHLFVNTVIQKSHHGDMTAFSAKG
jgi:hypothetical protein